MLLKDRIAQLAAQAVEAAQQSGALPAGPTPEIEVERPQNPEHGDFAISLPLRLARAARMSPMAIAERLVPLTPPDDSIQEVRAAAPGFINFVVKPAWLQQQVEEILQAGDTYGNLQRQTRERVQVEFASVNPTGPLHVGHARTAVLGSGLASILAAGGYDVSTEYYINDAGTQMDTFYRSLLVRYLQQMGRDAEMPESGYMGEYVNDLAREVAAEHEGRFLDLPADKAVAEIGAIGLEKMLAIIRTDLEDIQVAFDVWFSENSELRQKGEPAFTLQDMESNGYLADREGATWFTSTSLGEEKDNVLIRSTGEPTYFSLDIAYHRNKFIERGFDRVINIWGADHQGHISRMKSAVSALGIDPDRLTIIVSQLVTLKRGEETVRASKRSGEIVTLRELLEEAGSDACRFFFLSRTPESQMDFDLELAKKESADNPVYYVQYAHARIAGIMALAHERNLDYTSADVSLLGHEAETALIKKMVVLPELVQHMAETLEPHHLPRYSTELATAFHWFYQQCRVVSEAPEELPLTLARLKLVEACRIVLARCLSIMGMSAPEQM